MTVPGDRDPKHLEIIEALKRLPDLIEEEAAGLSESVQRARPSQDEWSIKETVGHLRDYAELTGRWFSTVCSLTDPMLPNLTREAELDSVKQRNYQDADLSALIAETRSFRLQAVGVLSHAVDWTRLGQLPRVGRRSLKQLAERAVEHEVAQLAQIRALKAQQGVAA
ncbi:MAG TPA: DinB family protein [Dehalococcoidia bacterium]|nr:DinB family protein [Dehalococcoidia bacterium]